MFLSGHEDVSLCKGGNQAEKNAEDFFQGIRHAGILIVLVLGLDSLLVAGARAAPANHRYRACSRAARSQRPSIKVTPSRVQPMPVRRGSWRYPQCHVYNLSHYRQHTMAPALIYRLCDSGSGREVIEKKWSASTSTFVSWHSVNRLEFGIPEDIPFVGKRMRTGCSPPEETVDGLASHLS